MKNLITITCLMLLLGTTTEVGAMLQQEQPNDESIQIWYSPELKDVAFSFVDAYTQINTEVSMSLNLLQGGMNVEPGHLAIVTKDGLKNLDIRSSRLNVLGKEVYVPIMNAGNPFFSEILEQGLSPNEFAVLYTQEKSTNWGALLNNGSSALVNAYRISDPAFANYLASFIEKDQSDIHGIQLGTCDDVINAIQNQKNAVGFCTMSQLANVQNSASLKNISLIPVDLNDNNKLDHFEEIYADVEDLSRGIWIGKYSASLYSRIFAVSSMESFAGPELEFVKWIASEGQDILAANGYSKLLENEQDVILASLENPVGLLANQDFKSENASVGLLLILLILGGVALGFVVLLAFNKKVDVKNETSKQSKSSLSGSAEIPGGYFFDLSHTWTFMERDGNIRLGVDSFLQGVAGSITRVDLRSPGEKVKKGETIVALIQNGKRMEVKSPISGVIHEQNQNLKSESNLINSSPFSEGWLYIVEPSNWADERASLTMGQKYKEWIKVEFMRLKDFLATILQSEADKAFVLQEGGEIMEGVLKDLGPEVWEEFQINFLKN